VIGFGIFKIRLDLTKFSRLESWVTWRFLRGVKEHHQPFRMVPEIM